MTELSNVGIRPLRGCFIDIYDDGSETIEVGGKPFFLLEDNTVQSVHQHQDGRHKGIRPRWARILAVSEKAYANGLRPDQHVLCDTLKWSRKVWFQPNSSERMSWISEDDILGVDDSKTA